MSFPLIETAIAFAAAMLAASLFVTAIVQALQNIGEYRSKVVERMLKSVFHGFRSFYNDPDVLAGDYPPVKGPGASPDELQKVRKRVLATEMEFVRDVLADPALHARSDGASYGGTPEELARSVEYIDASDLITIARNHAESAWAQPMAVTSPSEPPPPPLGSSFEAARTAPAASEQDAPDQPAPVHDAWLPAEWFFDDANITRADMASKRPFATVANFADYLNRWFPTFEATASDKFKKRIRRLTLVVSCTVVVLFNIDGFSLAAGLYQDSGKREQFQQRIPVLQAQAQRLGVVTADVQPEQPDPPAATAAQKDAAAEIGSLLRALEDDSLGLGWQGSSIVDKWCSFTGKCASALPKLTTAQIIGATVSWFLGLAFSCAMLSLGAPFWYNALTSALNLKSAVQVEKQGPSKATPAAKGLP